MEQLTIDPEFKRINRPLTKDEFALLEESVLESGFLEKWYVWRNEDGALVLLDAMHRYAISEKHDLPHPELIELEGTREEFKMWIRRHQAGRRNDSEAMAKYREGLEVRQSSKSARKIAKDKKKPRTTVRDSEKFANAVDKVDETVAEAVLSGEQEATASTLEAIAERTPEEQKEVLETARETGKTLAEAYRRTDDRLNQAKARFAMCVKVLKTFKSGFADLQKQFGGELANQEPAVLRNVKELENILSAMKPEAYCPYCRGKAASDIVEKATACAKCKGRGWLPKAVMKQVPKDVLDEVGTN